MTKLPLISILASVLILSSCGYHQKYHGKKFHEKHAKYMEEYFQKADKNQDGFISKKEHEQCSKKKFSMMDVNKDKKISKEELSEFKKKKWHKKSK